MTISDSNEHDPDARAIDSDGDEDQIESKSQRKRDARQVTALASELVAMKPKLLSELPLEQTVRDAIFQCAEIKAHGARKRQLHFVSKLLRKSANIEEIQRLVERPDLKKNSANLHQPFRDKLLDDIGSHVDALRESYPGADLQQVRQLVRNALNEHKKANSKEGLESEVKIDSTKSAKALLKLLSKSQ